jgi:DNA repair exonuclease SbcCD ATPase subunit
MKINSIHLQNIGPHKDLSVDFTDMGSLVAITGENGAGKSFLIEAVVACLYGSFPSRPGSLYDRMTQGFEGEASITIVFVMEGASYKAIRRMKRTGKTTYSTADLLNLDAPLKIAGPKVGDFETAVVNLLGPQDLFMASVFSSQMNSGDLCGARPAERKAVFAQLLGLGRFDLISAAAKDRARTADIEAETMERDMIRLGDRSSGLSAVQDDLKVSLGVQEQGMARLEALRSRAAQLEAEVRSGEVALEKWRGLDARVQQLDKEIEWAEGDLVGERARYQAVKGIIDRAPEIEKAEKDLADDLVERETLQAAIQAQERENSERRMEHQKQQSEFKVATQDFENRREAFKRLVEQASLLDKTPNQKCCEKCVLVASAVEAEHKMPAASQAMDIAEERAKHLADIIVEPKLHDVSANKTALAQCNADIESLKKMTADAPQLRDAQGRLSELVVSGKAKAAELEAKKAERVKVTAEANMAAMSVSDGARISLEQVRLDLVGVERELSTLALGIGALRERISGMEKAAVEAEAIGVKVKLLDVEANDYLAIEQAFGRSGIQPLIIEQARPELEAIAGELLGKATDGRMAVRFETQKELRTGETVESLDIIITMNGMERKIEEFSGGEQKMIRTAVRLTLAVWQARRGGSRLKTLFIDEIADALDGENSERMLNLLGSLTGQFERIFIVSHDDDLLEGIPARINLTKAGGIEKIAA